MSENDGFDVVSGRSSVTSTEDEFDGGPQVLGGVVTKDEDGAEYKQDLARSD